MARLDQIIDMKHELVRLTGPFLVVRVRNQLCSNQRCAAERAATMTEMHCRQIASAKRIRFTAIHFKERWDQSVAEHKAILQAFKERDAEKAGMLIERHVRRTGEFVLQHLDQIMAGHQDRGESGDH